MSRYGELPRLEKSWSEIRRRYRDGVTGAVSIRHRDRHIPRVDIGACTLIWVGLL
jgi:hypothetical protein